MVAEDGGDILGFAWSWVCGNVWFLAQLFVDPVQQGHGIGNELLKLTLDHVRKSGAAHKALITFTFNRVSQGLYIRHGLFPKMPIYFFGGARERVMAGLPDAPMSTIVIDGTTAQIKRLAVGYAYIGSDGHIGPLAVTQVEVLGDAFATALKMAIEGGSEQISAFLPGTCGNALSLVVKQGMRNTLPMLLMASPGFGDWTQYLPRKLSFM